MSLLDDLDREALLSIASGVAVVGDERVIVDHCAVLEAWVIGGESRRDAERRMAALRQVWRNCCAGKALAPSGAEEMVSRAAMLYAYLDVPVESDEKEEEELIDLDDLT